MLSNFFLCRKESAIVLAAMSLSWLCVLHSMKTRKIRRIKKMNKLHPHVRIPLQDLPSLKNDLLLRAAMGKKTERVPVWAMRQAGRHLPEFRQLREIGADFFTMCTIPELAVEVSLQPLRRYNMDAVIIFSDILVICQAMGMEVLMVPRKGPHFPKPIRHPEDIESLVLNPDIEKTLGYVLDAINLARVKIDGQVPLIGFCGAPFTLMTYMIEGGSSRTKSKVKTWLYNHKQPSHQLLQALANVCTNFLIAQQKAGAQALQVFETVGADELTQEHYFEYSFPYLKDIARRVKEACPDTPLICFSKGTSFAYDALADTQFDCLGMDWCDNPEEIRKIVGDRVSLQGNLDSAVIYANEEVIEEEVEKMIQRFGTQRYIANLGHGCQPDFKPEHMKKFFQTVQEISLKMNTSQHDM